MENTLGAYVVPKMTDEAIQRNKLIDRSRHTKNVHVLHHHSSAEHCTVATQCERYQNGEKI